MTRLHLAAQHRRVEEVRVTLERGVDIYGLNVDVNAVDSCGNTALHAAMVGGGEYFMRNVKDTVVIVNALIEAGSGMNVKNGWGQTPLDLAKRSELLEVVEILKEIKIKQPALRLRRKRLRRKTKIETLLKQHGAR